MTTSKIPAVVMACIPFTVEYRRAAQHREIKGEITQNRLNRAHVDEMIAQYQELGRLLDGQHAVLQNRLVSS